MGAIHKVFGMKENANYIDREGVYLVPMKEGKIGVVKTSKGYFLLGGGLDNGESHEECIKRECLEEAGYTVSVDSKVCSAEMYYEHPTIGYFHPLALFEAAEKIVIYESYLTKKTTTSAKTRQPVWLSFNL